MSSSGTIFLSIASLAFISLLMIVYFTKERIITSENKVFTKLLIISFISLLSELYITLMPLDSNIPLFIFSLKFYLIFVILWLSYFMEYVFIVTRNKKNKISIDYKNKYRKAYIIYWIFNVFVIIIAMLLPIFFYNGDTVKYSYGPSVNITFGLAAIYTIIMFFYIIKNISNIKDKGYMPIIFFVILLTVVAIIQKINPGLLLANTCFALITTLLYNTIENPDIKMLKELEYSKKLAEKSKDETINTLNYMQKELNKSLETITLLDSDVNNDNERKLINFITDFGKKVSGLIELGKINSSDYKVQDQIYETYEVLEDIRKLIINDKNISQKYSFLYSNDITKVLYGDCEKIKQIILYVARYINNESSNKKVTFKVNETIAGHLCKLKFTFIIEKSNEKYLINEINNDYVSNDYIKDMDYEIILTLLKMLNGKIEEKRSELGAEIVVSINQKIMKEYNITSNSIKETRKKIIPFNTNNKKILLVDRNEDRLKKIIKKIKPYNVDITICHGIEDLNDCILDDGNYQLILIDDIIFENNEKKLRETGNCEYSIKSIQRINCLNIPVIIMITKNNIKEEKKYLKKGFNDSITKPINKKQLNEVFKKYLQ